MTHDRIVPFIASDGFRGNLINVLGTRSPHRGPVVLVHGAGVRANIFRPPVKRTIVDALLDDGWDVWLENWRASIEFAPNSWTLDQAAVHDHPAAIDTVLRATGAHEARAIIHCQGSTSFMMSAVAGLLPNVSTIVSNAVSLHPVVPLASKIKQRIATPLVSLLTPSLDCRWGLSSPTALAKAITAWVCLTHHECDNIVCRYASFTYGTGRPTLWRHENLNDATHQWLTNEFAAVPMSFFRQIGRSITAGHLVANAPSPQLPDEFGIAPPRTTARMAFFAGGDNRCFLPESQRRTFRYFANLQPGLHSLHVIPGYSHLDMFMGQHAERDVFPAMLEALARNRS